MKTNRSNILGMAVLSGLLSCSENDGSQGPISAEIDYDTQSLINHLSENVILPSILQVQVKAMDFDSAVQVYCPAATANSVGDGESRLSLHHAWKELMSAWQRLEMMPIGPGLEGDTPVREMVYSWPVTSPCAVDQQVIAAFVSTNFSLDSTLANGRGLDAQEYVLFQNNHDSSCPTQIVPEEWNLLNEEDHRFARCTYLLAASEDILLQTESMVNYWNQSEDAFLGELKNAENGTGLYSNTAEVLNTVFESLFYLDFVTKEEKLAQPLGISSNICNVNNEPCYEELESQYAMHSIKNIQANLAGFEKLVLGIDYDGNNGPGFDDYLVAAGREDVKNRLVEATTSMKNAADAIEDNGRVVLGEDYNSLLDVHTKVKTTTDILKQEMPSILNLQIPIEASSEND